MRYLSIVVLLSVLLLSLPKTARCMNPAPLSVTEQINIAGAGKVGMMLGVAQAGEVKIVVAWQGQPISLELKNGLGVSVSKLIAQSAPQATLTYTATVADMKGHTPWRAVISLTKPDADNKAVGSATITVPSLIPLDTMMKDYKAGIDAASAQAAAKVAARIQAFEQRKMRARDAKVAKVATARQANMQSWLAQQTTHTSLITHELSAVVQTVVTDPDAPVITACSVSTAGPNDQVTLTGRKFAANTVYLEIPTQDPLTVTGAVATDTTVRFAMPNYAIADGTKAYLYLKGRTAPFPNGKVITSNKVPVWLNASIPVLAPLQGPATTTPAGGHPGDPILLYGTGMDPNGKVHFILAPGDDREARTENWSQYQVTAFLPDPGPFATPINAQVYVICNGHKSAPQPLVITPELEVKEFKFWANLQDYSMSQDSDYFTGDQSLVSWLTNTTHFRIYIAKIDQKQVHNDPPSTFTRDDEFYKTKHMVNNWVVDSVDFTPLVAVTLLSDVSLKEYRQGTDSPYMKVHWSAKPVLFDVGTEMEPGPDMGKIIWCGVTYAPVAYELHMTVKGPKGTSYW